MNFENLNKFLKPFNRINQLGKKKKTYISHWADLNFGPLATGCVARPAHGPNGLGRHNVGGSRLQGVCARAQGGPKGQASWAARRAPRRRWPGWGGWRLEETNGGALHNGSGPRRRSSSGVGERRLEEQRSPTLGGRRALGFADLRTRRNEEGVGGVTGAGGRTCVQCGRWKKSLTCGPHKTVKSGEEWEDDRWAPR
jgi:hypothetical protein